MNDLNIKLNADWAKLFSAAENIDSLDKYLQTDTKKLRSLAGDLKSSTHTGSLLYKKSALMPFFTFLESTTRRIPTNQQLAESTQILVLPVYVSILQWQMALGKIPLFEEKEQDVIIDIPDVKEILLDIKNRITQNPEVGRHPSVKNIQMKMNIYRTEIETMKKLAANIQKDKAASFYSNFRNKIAELTESIQKQYRILIEEDLASVVKPKTENKLKNIDLKLLATKLETQAKKIYSMKSSIEYIIVDGYKKNDVLQDLLKQKFLLFSHFEEEFNFFNNLDPSGLMYKKYIEETITKVNRQADRLSY